MRDGGREGAADAIKTREWQFAIGHVYVAPGRQFVM